MMEMEVVNSAIEDLTKSSLLACDVGQFPYILQTKILYLSEHLSF